MKLRTSFFNRTVLKKDITRFAPVWVLYTLFLFLCTLYLSGNKDYGATARSVAQSILATSLLNLVYALITGTLLYGDLFQNRACNALHATPLRREGWFLTHTTAGLLFALIPNLICALAFSLMLQEFAYMIWLWLAAAMLQYLFFFGVAALCAQLSGNWMGMLSIYGIVNYFSAFVCWVIHTFYTFEPYSILPNPNHFYLFSPAAYIPERYFVSFDWTNTDGWVFYGIYWENWIYLFVIAAVGLAFLALALLLYRKRKLELAGSLLHYRFLGSLIPLVCALLCGGILYSIDFLPHIPCLIIGVAVGFFVGMVFLKRSVRVFQLKPLLYFLILCGVLVGSVLLVKLDPLDSVHYVPEPSSVQKVEVRSGHMIPGRIDYYDLPHIPEITSSDPMRIERICDLHTKLVRYDRGNCIRNIEIRYTLKNGLTVSRYYYIDLIDAELIHAFPKD